MVSHSSSAPSQVRRTYVDGPFGQMHVRMAGDLQSPEPPLVCFHMSPMSGRIFEHFIGWLSRHGRAAVAVDTPGLGMSDATAAPPSIEDYACAMEAAAHALGLSRPIDLMGYHTGSMIAAELAGTRPELVRRVVLVSAPIFTAAEREAMMSLYAPIPPAMDGSHLVKRWRSFLHYNLRRGTSLEDVAEMFPEGLLGRSKNHWGHRAAFSYSLEARLPTIEQPLLLLNPGDDLQAETRRAPPLLRRAQLVEIPSWGHGFLDGFTEEAGRLIVSFLEAPDAAPFADLDLPESARETLQ